MVYPSEEARELYEITWPDMAQQPLGVRNKDTLPGVGINIVDIANFNQDPTG
jgi:hypothetical protein